MSEQEETSLGTSSVSKNWQTAVIREVRPYLNLDPKKKDRIEWVRRGNDIIVRKAEK